MRVLLVEDDALLGDGIRAGLTQIGFAVDWVRDGREAELAVSAQTYDAVILDLGLPRLPGLGLSCGSGWPRPDSPIRMPVRRPVFAQCDPARFGGPSCTAGSGVAGP